MKQVWCPCCKEWALVIEEPLHTDDLNPWPWGDIVCGRCHLVIATLRGRDEENNDA